MNHTMSNDELAAAIQAAHILSRNTAPNEPTYVSVCAHLITLLRVQQERAMSNGKLS